MEDGEVGILALGRGEVRKLKYVLCHVQKMTLRAMDSNAICYIMSIVKIEISRDITTYYFH